jgi:hypothetical protein
VDLATCLVYEAEKAVISWIDPHRTFLKYIGEENLTAEFADKIKGWRWETSSFCSLHLALADLPAFNTDQDIGNGFMYILGYETPDDLLNQFKAISEGRLPAEVGCDAVFPTMHDPSQAPAGKHTASMYEHAPYDLKDGALQQAKAVESGYWPLFRFDPAKPKGKKFRLDSKEPSIPIQEFMYNEMRFKRVAKDDAELGKTLLKEAQEEVDSRWERLELFRNM